MSEDEVHYLERRATAAIALAQQGEHPAAVKAHYAMASAYLARLYPASDEQPKAAQGR